MKVFTLFSLLIAFVSATVFIACNKEEHPPPVKEIALFFIDKTTSTKADDFIQAKNEKWLKTLAAKHKKHGTEFIVSYLFANSANVTNLHHLSYVKPKLELTVTDPTAKKLAKMKHEERLERYDEKFDKQLNDLVFTPKKMPTGSNIVGSLKHILNVHLDNPEHSISVYYMSDMQECSDFRAMYCNDAKKPKEYSNVSVWAHEDYDKVKEKYYLPNVFSKQIQGVTVILPAHEMETSNAYELIPAYWNIMFRKFGITNIQFH